MTTENYKIVSIVIVKWYFHCSAGLKKVISNSLNSLQDSELEQLISAQFSLHVRALAMAVESRAGEGEGARVGAGAEAVRQLLGGFDNFPLLERVIREEREENKKKLNLVFKQVFNYPETRFVVFGDQK